MTTSPEIRHYPQLTTRLFRGPEDLRERNNALKLDKKAGPLAKTPRIPPTRGLE